MQCVKETLLTCSKVVTRNSQTEVVKMWMTLEVDEFSEIEEEDFGYREVEGVRIKDKNGKYKFFKVKAILSMNNRYFVNKFPDVDWDESNLKIALVVGEEIGNK